MTELTLTPISAPFHATIAPPGSKSLTNRALVMAALANGRCTLTNVLFADDSLVMLDGLKKLGFSLEIDEPNHTVVVHGLGGAIPATAAELFCGLSGTTIRFLAAMCALGKGTFTLDGTPRMRQRPIKALGELIRDLGGRVAYPMNDGFPPIQILADGLPGGVIRYGSHVSSQFLSAVLMAAPYTRHEVKVELDGEQTSWPYVAMTMQLMDHFGVTPELVRDPATGNPKRVIVPSAKYAPTTYAVEPDASNAAYFLATAAINPGSQVTVQNLGKTSLQGDVGIADVLRRMGAKVSMQSNSITVAGTDDLHGIEVNLANMPDQAQTLAVVALFAEDETVIRGLHTLRVKETDRLTALSNELKKFGAQVAIEGDDTLTITPPKKLTGATVATYDDHRMAMSFAVAGTKLPGVTIQDPQCVNKSYPQFFGDLTRVVSGR